MTSLWLDLRYALRMMARTPGLTAVLLLTLAIGIGATTTIFSVVESMLLRPVPYDRPEQLVRIYTELGSKTDSTVAPAEYVALARDCRSCAQLGAWGYAYTALAGGDRPVGVRGARATASLLPVLGVRPLLGRWFDASEDRPGPPTVVVLGYDVWQDAFAGDRAIIGRTIQLDAMPVTVVGVMPPDFDLLYPRVEAWFPYGLDPATASRGAHFLRIIARLTPGATVESLNAEIAALIPRWSAQLSLDDPPPSPTHPIYARPFQTDVVTIAATPLWLLQGAVLLVLVIAIVNVANLLLTRAESRSREIAVRHALGASRRRLVRQLLTESAVLGLCGGGLGVLVTVWSVAGLLAIIPRAAPRYSELRVDGTVVMVAAGCAIASSLIFGLAPILHAHRTDLHGALKDGSSRMTGSRRGARLRRALVIGEIALAIPLVVTCSVMVRGFLRSQEADPGFAPDHLLTFGITLPRATYPGTTGDVFWHRLEDRLRALAGVRRVALVDTLPIIGGDYYWTFEIPDQPQLPGEPALMVDQGRVAGDDAFAALGARIVRGRGFSLADTAGAPDVVVINQTFAARYFPGQDPVGRRLVVSAGRATPCTIIGVFADMQQKVDRPVGTEMMIPLWQYASSFDPPQSRSSMTVAIRTAGDPAALLPAAQRAVAELDPILPLITPITMEEGSWLLNAPWRILAQLLSVFAGIALALAAVGIYGMMAHTVAQRTAEIGLRVALGAPPAEVRAMVLRQAAALAAAGIALGLGAAIAIDRALGADIQNLLFHGERLARPGTCAAVALTIAATALLASWIPARRATRIEPTVALRNE